jgi:hypothetical protein
MAGFTNVLENLVLDHVFSVSTYTPPTIWLGLFTVAPTDTSTGTECTGAGYTRIAAPTWVAASSGQTVNSTAIAFPVAASTTWGTIEYFAICTSSAAGAMLAYSSLTVSKTITTGDSVTFSTGAIVVTLD